MHFAPAARFSKHPAPNLRSFDNCGDKGGLESGSSSGRSSRLGFTAPVLQPTTDTGGHTGGSDIGGTAHPISPLDKFRRRLPSHPTNMTRILTTPPWSGNDALRRRLDFQLPDPVEEFIA